MLSIIAAIGKNGELGKSGELLFHIPEDMKFFRETTMGHSVLMGRRTWESLPGKLPGRKNIVASRNKVVGADEVVKDLEDFILRHQNTEEEIFVIGGGMVYFATLPYAKKLYITEVDAEDKKADTFFPDFDVSKFDREVLGGGVKDDLKYKFVKYERKEQK